VVPEIPLWSLYSPQWVVAVMGGGWGGEGLFTEQGGNNSLKGVGERGHQDNQLPQEL